MNRFLMFALGMRFFTYVAVGFLAAILPPTAAVAQTAPAPVAGAEVALRTGLALSFGSIDGGAAGRSLDSFASSAVPIIVEGGYRIDANLFVGLRFQYAFPQLKSPNETFICGSNSSCSGSVRQIGLEGIYRFLASRRFAPWLGLGTGYEWISADYNLTGIGIGGTNRGFQGLVQFGGDLRLSPRMVLGPFVEATAGRYDRAENRGYGGVGAMFMSGSKDVDITDTAWHTWLTLGVRAAFGF